MYPLWIGLLVIASLNGVVAITAYASKERWTTVTYSSTAAFFFIWTLAAV